MSLVIADRNDFVGDQPNQLTANPASVAVINRFHLQFDGLEYNVLERTESNPFKDTEAGEGQVQHGALRVVWPFAFGVELGVEDNDPFEEYPADKPLARKANRNASDQVNRVTSSVLFGKSFGPIAIGVRGNRQDFHILKERKFSKTVVSDPTFSATEGSATAFTTEVGILVPKLFNFLDLGLVSTPTSGGIVEFAPAAGGAEVPLTEEFEEPGRNVLGLGTSWEVGRMGLHVLADVGTIDSVEKDVLGETREAGSLRGGMVRLTIPSMLDVSYGSRLETTGELSLQTETINLQLPLFFVEGETFELKLHHQRLLSE